VIAQSQLARTDTPSGNGAGKAMKLKISLSILLLTILLGLVACGKQEDDNGMPIWEEAPCPLELPESVVQGQDIICGYMTVPEEHDNPDGKTIRLAVAVIKSTSENPAPDPLVVEAGGPGASTLAGIPSMLGSVALGEQRDIVLIEQRGTPYSKPYLLCEEVSDSVVKMLGQGFSDEQAATLLTQALSTCRERLIAGGVNLSAYNSLENTADIVMVLTALGYDEFNFYGISYATMLAQHLMRDNPDRLRSVILDGVAPLSVNGFVQLPNSADRAFRLLFESCAADPVCNHHFPNLETVFFNLVEALNKNPRTVYFAPSKTNILMTGDRLIWQLFTNLQRGPIPMLPASIYAMVNGDDSLMASFGIPFLPGSQFISGMSNSVLCAEETDYTESDWNLEGIYPQIGALIRAGFDVRDECVVWNVEPLSDDASAPAVSDIPTLILSGEFDPNTPPSAGSLVAETLNNAYVYTFPGIAHGALSNSLCAQSITLDFLDDPTHEPDASCIADMGLQFLVPTDGVQMKPFTSEAYGIRGVLPVGWVNVGPGLFVRLNSNGDLAFLTLVKLPDLPLDQHLTPRLQRLGIDELPDVTDHYATAALTWDLYTFEGNMLSLGRTVIVDYGVTETDVGTYFVGLYALPNEYEGLHEAVFLPVMDALTPVE
jgi:pimeloyl-ACP methyl ester carboxylesterase